MSKLESTKRLLRRWFSSLPFFALLGLILGVVMAIPLVPRPQIATLTISGTLYETAYAEDAVKILSEARKDKSIKAVVLEIDSPGGYVVTVEAIYLDLLRLKQVKPIVTAVRTIAASGGYYLAVAANYIYALPTSMVGSVGAWTSLPELEKMEEDVIASGLFKAAGGTRRKAVEELEMIRQEFVATVRTQRGDRLKLSDEELSRAEIYLGSDGLKYGLIDEIGTTTDAVEKAAALAGIRNYRVKKLQLGRQTPFWSFGSSEIAVLKSRTSSVPLYYYLYFESE